MGKGFSILMNKRTRFTKIIRIDPKQLEYIRSLRKFKTLAGRLDSIINFYKEHNK